MRVRQPGTRLPGTRLAALLLVVTVAACSADGEVKTPPDVREFATSYAAAWSSREPARIAAHFSESGSLQINEGEPSAGRSAITATAQSFMDAYPDMVVVLDSLGEAGDRVVFHWTWTGTNTGPGGTGRAVKISGAEHWLFGPDGLISDSKGHFDGAELERQLEEGGPLPQWEFDPAMVFPSDGSLDRPEDGVVLPDGSLIVGDQPHGLRRVAPDGSSAPFGNMVAAGYVHRPPDHAGGANGVSLEPAGTHLLVADIFHGGIFRVDIETGEAERVYQHGYGVNTAVRDSRGAIWFTQSAHNTPEEGEARMWASVDVPAPEGALLRLGMVDGQLAEQADVLVDSLYYANGVALDEKRGYLYLAETIGGRLLRYRVDLDAGQLSERFVLVEGLEPDNLELDSEGRLWVALPLSNGVIVVDPESGARHYAFRAVTPEQLEVKEEFIRRGEAAIPRMELFTPAMWSPLPGLLTGLIVGAEDDPVYLTGLGDALVKLDR